jgi:hypothetical protein
MNKTGSPLISRIALRASSVAANRRIVNEILGAKF